MNERPQHADVVDLVERREKVGRLLLDLRRFANELLSHAAERDRQIFNILVSIGFSLWRAAFLIDGRRDRPLINQHAVEFLDVLLWDNAINFPQDRRTHAFTSGYYVNNACVRLLSIRAAIDLAPQDIVVFDRISTFHDDQWNSPNDSPDLRQGWTDCYVAALLSVESLTTKVNQRRG